MSKLEIGKMYYPPKEEITVSENLVRGPGWKVEKKGDAFVFEFLAARHGGGTDAYEITEKEFSDLKAGYLHFEDLMIKYDQGPFNPIKSN